jgi:aspartyl-tRNA(Asn)/glutamyl-tRNA(Gln) amidotransferase subunit A
MVSTELSVAEIARRVGSGELRAEQVADVCLARAREQDPLLHAFVHIDEASVLERARAVDERRARGLALGPLAGVPVAVKDSICTVDAPTTCASKALIRDGKPWRSPYDATAIERLLRADAVLFGKTNLDEFAMGSSTENSGMFCTRNPWDPTRVPGGSSGGSAAAVAARMVPAALGSDTGGSIRQPASFTATVGIKPTYGRVSRYGLVAFASSLDQIGPIASDVPGAARLLEVMAGRDDRDATSSRTPVPPMEQACSLDAQDLRIGIPEEYFGEGLDAQVEGCVRGAIDALRAAGCSIERIRLPHTSLAVATYYVLATAEASSNLARFDGIRFGSSTRPDAGDLEEMYAATRGAGFGREVKRRIMLGTYVLSAGYYDAYYVRAQRARSLVAADFARAFEQVDVIAAPTAPTPAWRMGEKLEDPLAMYLADVYTLPASLAGLPALSVPCGWTNDGLPVGLQLMGRRWREDELCQVAATWERIRMMTDRSLEPER